MSTCIARSWVKSRNERNPYAVGYCKSILSELSLTKQGQAGLPLRDYMLYDTDHICNTMVTNKGVQKNIEEKRSGKTCS